LYRILNIEPAGYSDKARAILQRIGHLDEREISADALRDQIENYDILIVRLRNQINQEILSRATNLKAIVTATTGLDHIDTYYAAQKGIAILSLKGEIEFLNSIWATAEHTWGLLLSLLRKIPAATRDVINGNWERDKFKSHELHGKTLGIVGFGRIGRKIAAYGGAFGMKVLAYETDKSKFVPEVEFVDSIKKIMQDCDVISLHVPLEEKNYLLIGEKELAETKSGAILVNTSRGEIVDESALLKYLQNGRLAGAALDVLADERMTSLRENPLVAYAASATNLLITPHSGGATFESMEKTEVFMAEKLAVFLGKQQMD
jgi:D-3-phosphoglycerate dehydrogenase / 2-oxoglutarate reductase